MRHVTRKNTWQNQAEFGINGSGANDLPEFKKRGDKGMSLKQNIPEQVQGIVLQRLNNMVKAGLLEIQFPVMVRTSVSSTYVTR